MAVTTNLTSTIPTPLSKILSLARSGSPARAWDLFVAEGWDRVTDDPKALTLKGRLLKDQAKAADGVSQQTERDRLYGEAAVAYAGAAAIQPDSYPLINAAALALLSGDAASAAERAALVLELVDSDPDEGENAYWREATRAEALLLMGRVEEAQQALAHAIEQIPQAWEDHAATIGQFALILEKQQRDAGWLDQHRPPPSVHFSGMIRLQKDDDVPSAIDEYLKREQPGFAYGSLAAGADLLFAQAFLDRRDREKSAAELHVMLPFPVDQFRALSVEPFGAEWLPQFDAVLEQADTVTILGLDDPPLKLAIDLADRTAMGQAIRNAQNLQSHAKAVTVAAEGEPLRPQLEHWKSAGHEMTVLNGQRRSDLAGELAQGTTSQVLGTLVRISGATDDQLRPAADQVELRMNGSERWIALDNLDIAYATAAKLAANDDPGMGISMLQAIMDIDAPPEDLLGRAEAFASASLPGAMTTDYCTAMALSLSGAAQSIEEIGELKSAWGALPLWRII